MFSEVYAADFTDEERHSLLAHKVLAQYEFMCESDANDEIASDDATDTSEEFDDYKLRMEYVLEGIQGGVRAHLWIYLMVDRSVFSDGDHTESWKHSESPYQILSEHFIDEKKRVMSCDYTDPPIETALDDEDFRLIASIRMRLKETHEYDE